MFFSAVVCQAKLEVKQAPGLQTSRSLARDSLCLETQDALVGHKAFMCEGLKSVPIRSPDEMRQVGPRGKCYRVVPSPERFWKAAAADARTWRPPGVQLSARFTCFGMPAYLAARNCVSSRPLNRREHVSVSTQMIGVSVFLPVCSFHSGSTCSNVATCRTSQSAACRG